MERYSAKVCYGSGGGGGGGGSSYGSVSKSQTYGTSKVGLTTFAQCAGSVGGILGAIGAASKGNLTSAYGAALGASAAGGLCVNGIVAAVGKGAPDYSGFNAMGDYSGR